VYGRRRTLRKFPTSLINGIVSQFWRLKSRRCFVYLAAFSQQSTVADEPMLSRRRRSKMKKVMLVTLVLAVCGVLHNSVLAQETDRRYLVTYVSSSTNVEIRSATVVTVVNQSSSTCNVQVEWFVFPLQDGALIRRCIDVAMGVVPGEAVQFCSRTLPNSIAICSQTCEPPLATLQHQGKAIVSSSEGFECSRLGVEARVYYTTGVAGAETAISAISNSKIVFFGEGNLGD
jgi:hypothetical protein